MGTRHGTLLERNVAKIFSLAGFDVKIQARVNGYEIDVYAKKGNLIVICECKQYEKSAINIRNLIHLWDSKNKEIDASKIIIALFGVDPSNTDYQLAKKYGIILWQDKDVANYLDVLIDNREKGIRLLVEDLSINPIHKANAITEKEKYRLIGEKDFPLTKSIAVFFESEIITGSARIIHEPTSLGGIDNKIRTSDLDVCFAVKNKPKSLTYWIQNDLSPMPNVTAIWLNSTKEIVDVLANGELVGGLFTKHGEFSSKNDARYCLLLKSKMMHRNLKIRDKLMFGEIL